MTYSVKKIKELPVKKAVEDLAHQLRLATVPP
jgi:hypothetical protein